MSHWKSSWISFAELDEIFATAVQDKNHYAMRQEVLQVDSSVVPPDPNLDFAEKIMYSEQQVLFDIDARLMIDLAFREYGSGSRTLVILHGLLGSSQNWQRAAKVFAEKYRVLGVDLRNHGDSPHTPTHSIAGMRDDLKDFFEHHGIEKACVLGHSMGGVVAMEFAFHHAEHLSSLIIEDVAPRAYPSDSGEILQALASIDLSDVSSRQQVDEQLAKKIASPVTRQFLLTNLVRNENQSFSWRVNLAALLEFRNEMGTYKPPAQARYEGETLFIGGEKSAYRIDRDRDLILWHFPNSRLAVIPDAGHWIHFEALDEFTRVVDDFIERGNRLAKK